MHGDKKSVAGPIIITVDFEDWLQVENLRPCFPYEKWESCELRIERSVYRLLELFDTYSVQATFFILGWIAARRRELVAEIAGMGHEIASHGYYHRICYDLPVSELRKDLEMGRDILGEITGKPPLGYRAPNFSITDDLVSILWEYGFAYDSSYNSFSLNKRYGKVNGLIKKQDHLMFENGLTELPVSNLGLAGRIVPWAGGGYFRFWPTQLFELGVSRIIQKEGHYVFYCHPWEFDPAQPRQRRGLGSVSRFRHYLHLDKTFKRLRHFFETFRDSYFISCSCFLDLQGNTGAEKTGPEGSALVNRGTGV